MIKKISQILIVGFLLLVLVQPVFAFRFISWADTKSARSTLSELSNQAVTFNPAFTIYPGDLESSGFTQSGMNQWKDAMNGGSNNGMFDITFPTRGNHDDSNTSDWQAYFNLQGMANRVGAVNYSYLNDDLTYSFDYGNSHFVGIDVAGDASKISSGQLNWLDSDLSAAESRGLTHAFIYFHGPIYCVDGHCDCSERTCSLGSSVENLISIINKHPIVTASFHGHEHIYTYTYLDNTRIPNLTHSFHQFVTGDAGAGPKSPKSARVDWHMSEHGFITVDVNGSQVAVSWYKQGSNTSQHSLTFTKGSIPPPPVKKGDFNGDSKVDIVDLGILLSNWGSTSKPPADINQDGKVDVVDLGILLSNWG